jgi:hypothetical protein
MKRSVLPKLVLATALAAAVVAVAAPGASARLVPPRDSPFGRTYAAWDVVWGTAQARRVLASRNSLLALRGNRCGFAWSQRVWLLPASINGLITVNCTIPAGMYLVFPIAGVVEWGKSPEKMRQSVRSAFRAIRDVRLTVDGRDLGRGYVTRTPVYVTEVPPNNVFGWPAGSLSLMSKDYFAVLSPLAKGRHTVTAVGTFANPTTTLGMTYRLRVR